MTELGRRRLLAHFVAALVLLLALVPAAGAQSNPFLGRGMWIWYVSASNGGDLASIAAKSRRYGIKTLMIKSGDGTNVWSQFTPQLVSTLHSYGLRVCAWQYVYGTHPVYEANVGAVAVKDGADCLLIDAESEYEGKYVQAQRYVAQLRKQIGQSFPVALAGFPYVDYHPAFPYSVLLGPGGAQYNVPQMYWVDIGTTVSYVYSHTYAFNRLYGRWIYPLGQIYNNPPNADVIRFRQLSLAYGAGGISWWDWQEASNAGWRALNTPIGYLAGFTPNTGIASVGLHAQGDLVIWAQEHLVSAGQRISIDGAFGPHTQQAVRNFQTAAGLSSTGLIDASTWRVLLRYAPAPVHWTRDVTAAAASAGAGRLTLVPKSASLKAKANELHGHPGRG
jgi:hypothetical protein